MKSLKPKLAWTKQLVLKNKNAFLESNFDFLRGQSNIFRSFAEKGLASLATTEISARATAEVVEQSKVLCEDYIYNRMAGLLHCQLERRCQSRQPTSPEATTTTTTGVTNDDDDDDDDEVFTDRRRLSMIYNANSYISTDQPNSPSLTQNHDPTENSSPDKIGQARYNKWRSHLTDVSAEIQSLGLRLELAYPHLYDNLAFQLKMPLKSAIAIEKALTTIGDFMFNNSVVTWYRIVGLFAVAGAMALECIDNHHGQLISSIIHVFSQIIDRHVATWICKEGGWVALLQEYQPGSRKYLKLVKWMGVFIGFFSVLSIPFRIL